MGGKGKADNEMKNDSWPLMVEIKNSGLERKNSKSGFSQIKKQKAICT